jgi:hypothetical protein
MKNTLKVLATTVAILGTTLSAPAYADGLTASLSKSAELSREGEALTLSLSGVPSGQGVYILQCVAPIVDGARPTACVAQNKTIWASTVTSPGASALTPTMTVFVDRQIVAGGNAIDCSISNCGIFIRRDHNGPTDKTLDTFLPITFAPEYSVQVAKTSAIAYGGENLKVNVVGLTGSQGIYVRLCQAVTAGERPAVCDGLGVWASLSSAQQAYGAVDPKGELTLPVKPSFGTGPSAVDCTKTPCVVFVRRDHLAGSDLTLDRIIPITFTAAPTPVVSASVSKAGGNFVFVVKNAKSKSLKVKVGTVSQTIKPTSDVFSFKVAVGKNKGKKTELQVIYGSKVITKAIVKG